MYNVKLVGAQGGVRHAPINCGEICDRAVKVLTENFYCSIASIKLLRRSFIAKILLDP